ncbi:helix-hairpin-helix domain-containing protein [Undibacterium oligocarboniphilum]|uniref:Helix-hairpin-helix domain-containing protein n=1 Tax=Undibacterium oligocarboniphilum TaxID=666702 RepID=A0A850Q8I3_9BURK|nr:helix-hairpin-helix domain-containing protein [Undibacterium oligocarboniphilum]MBC3870804.1 helix-hairpin-helix domain-containing protein [Undibacterium oligocarboniphilum]NVO76572.1 helix-hairpin-helix domain-containing protein [Undibacterium oligocarboniphilum]
MHPAKVRRDQLHQLTDLPNIGSACAADLALLGIQTPQQLIGACPFTLYRQLCDITGMRHDPCMIDVLMSVTDFMNGAPARSWWDYTAARKVWQAAQHEDAAGSLPLTAPVR